MGSMSMMHWLIVVAVVVLLFGKGKISGMMGDVAEGIKSFKKGMQDDKAAEQTSSAHPLLTNATDIQTPSPALSARNPTK